MRAGKPWSSDSGAPLTSSARSEWGFADLAGADRRLAEGAARLQRAGRHRRRAGHPGGRGEIAQAHAGPALGRRPALDAGDLQVVRVLGHRGQLGERQLALVLADELQPIGGADHRRRDPRDGRGLVDREGRARAARREERHLAQRPADRLPRCRHRERPRGRADEPEQPAAAQRPGVGIGGTQVVVGREDLAPRRVGPAHRRELDRDVQHERGDEDRARRSSAPRGSRSATGSRAARWRSRWRTGRSPIRRAAGCRCAPARSPAPSPEARRTGAG